MTIGRVGGWVIGLVLGAVVIAGAVVGTVVLGIRSRNPRIVRGFTRFQRDGINPRVLQTAGGPDSPWAVVEHVGRTTGRPYETPVGAVRDGDDWVITLPYGPETSWVRNVVAAGEAVVRVNGERHRVGDVRIVPLSSTPMADTDVVAARLFGVTSAMRLRDTTA
jgi:deazaflavin-dependent oxidoreductase (nitroreductase family)